GAGPVRVRRYPVVQRGGVAVAVVAVNVIVQPAVAGPAARPDQAAARVVREGRVLQRDRDGDRAAVIVTHLERLVGAVRGVVRVGGVVVVVTPGAEREPVDDSVPRRRGGGHASRTG